MIRRRFESLPVLLFRVLRGYVMAAPFLLGLVLEVGSDDGPITGRSDPDDSSACPDDAGLDPDDSLAVVASLVTSIRPHIVG